ncbi:MAG: NAD(+)/NADH kinase [Candidatus Nanoarchaeia archaeon]
MKLQFNKILVVENEKTTNKHIQVVKQVKEILTFLNKNYSIIKFKELHDIHFDKLDLVITIGGDGVFIRTSHFLRKTPIIGINSEPELSEGALTSLQDTEVEKLKDILAGNYNTIQRERARVLKNDKLICELALNEVYIGTNSQFHVSRYIIEFKDISEEQRSSGVLVVTGSGSNAWYKSAGGSPFNYNEKKLKVLVREPYISRIFKPKILNLELTNEDEITFISKRRDGGIIAIDGNVTYEFNNNDRIDVRISLQPLNIISKA